MGNISITTAVVFLFTLQVHSFHQSRETASAACDEQRSWDFNEKKNAVLKAPKNKVTDGTKLDLNIGFQGLALIQGQIYNPGKC